MPDRPETTDRCAGTGQIPTGECRVAMSGPTCSNPDCPPCQTPETDPCPGCTDCQPGGMEILEDAVRTDQFAERLRRAAESKEGLAALQDDLCAILAAERERLRKALCDHDVQDRIAEAIGRAERDEITADGMAREIYAALDPTKGRE